MLKCYFTHKKQTLRRSTSCLVRTVHIHYNRPVLEKNHIDTVMDSILQFLFTFFIENMSFDDINYLLTIALICIGSNLSGYTHVQHNVKVERNNCYCVMDTWISGHHISRSFRDPSCEIFFDHFSIL